MPGIYDDDVTDPAVMAKQKVKKKRSALLNFGENLYGAIGALLLTYAVCFVLAWGFLWIASRMISIGIPGGRGAIWIIALFLTIAFYWYDRRNPLARASGVLRRCIVARDVRQHHLRHPLCRSHRGVGDRLAALDRSLDEA